MGVKNLNVIEWQIIGYTIENLIALCVRIWWKVLPKCGCTSQIRVVFFDYSWILCVVLSVVICFALFYFVLICFILFYPILSNMSFYFYITWKCVLIETINTLKTKMFGWFVECHFSGLSLQANLMFCTSCLNSIDVSYFFHFSPLSSWLVFWGAILCWW